MAKYVFIVAVRDQAECAEFMEPGHEWCVEGDYGFQASFKTQGEAWARASEEAEAVNARDGAGTCEVCLNA